VLYKVHRSLLAMPSTCYDASTYPGAARAGMKITAHASVTVQLHLRPLAHTAGRVGDDVHRRGDGRRGSL